MLYWIVEWVHVAAAMVAFGANVTYFVWLTRAARDPAMLPFSLTTIGFLEGRVANPSYGVAGISGVLMIWIGPYTFTTGWVLGSIVLFLMLGAIGGMMYGPNLKQQIQVARDGKAETAEYRDLHRRGNRIGTVLVILVLAIVYLMVARPVLFGR